MATNSAAAAVDAHTARRRRLFMVKAGFAGGLLAGALGAVLVAVLPVGGPIVLAAAFTFRVSASMQPLPEFSDESTEKYQIRTAPSR
jgi:hypothetical protein